MKPIENQTREQKQLQLLQQLGYHYLTPAETTDMRGGNQGQVILEPILREQIKRINGNLVSEENIDRAIQALYNPPSQEGYLPANQYIYNLLRRGIVVGQAEDSGIKNYLIHYIDWEYPGNNRFDITDQYSVTSNGRQSVFYPDTVLFINGIPVGIIECKTSHQSDHIRGAIEQHLRNQLPDGIRELYLFSQILFSLTPHSARYGTNGTPVERWHTWNEYGSEDTRKKLEQLLGRTPTPPDELLYNMARPDRLLDLLRRFILYTNGTKIVARAHQFFAVQVTLQRIREKNRHSRPGGVIWHTQGSGKSFTMVMLAQAILLDRTIRAPKIILVTDRLDADYQLTDIFRSCGTHVEQATTGKMLAELLQNQSSAVVSTVVQKFGPAMKQMTRVQDSCDIFVLVDEAHRSQEMLLKQSVQQVLPNACFIGFTGMPFTEKYKDNLDLFDNRNLFVYDLMNAVNDGVVLPVCYESRTFGKQPLLMSYEALHAPERMKAIARNISEDFRTRSEGKKGDIKAMFTCCNREAALHYKRYFDEIGIVSTEAFVSHQAEDPKDFKVLSEQSTPEMAQTVKELNDFIHRITDTYGSVRKYHENLLYRFKNSSQPELLIVVDRLLTGFDEPRNTVLYIDRPLQGPGLLQALSRVNRVYPGKERGYIVDYYGIKDPLIHALPRVEYPENNDLAQLIVREPIPGYSAQSSESHSKKTAPEFLAESPEETFERLTYPILQEELEDYYMAPRRILQIVSAVSSEVNRIVRQSIYLDGKMIVDWPFRLDICRSLMIEWTDYLADRVKEEFNITLSLDTIDKLLRQWLETSVEIYGKNHPTEYQ